jgi:hypothetical protein
MQTHGEMNMVGNATHTKTIALPISNEGCQISMQRRPDILIQQWLAILGAENNVDQHETQRLGHGANYKSGLQPSHSSRIGSWGFAPGWYQAAPLALFAAMTLLLLTACKPTPPPTPKPTPQTTHYPTRPSTPPSPFRIFHQTDTTLTLVTTPNATDAEISAILYQLHDSARAHTFDTLHIPQKLVDARHPILWFHIYRGPKCAPEKYAATPPCGASYHAAGDYTLGSYTNPNWDDAELIHDENHEVQLWNPDAPSTK